MSIITKDLLCTEDLDTNYEDILYTVTLHPKIGFLQLSTHDKKKINNFTQSKL